MASLWRPSFFMRFIFISLCLVFVLAPGKGTAQWKQALEQLSRNLDSLYQYNPFEKCYLHTDKDWYFPGETIWFRTYVTVDEAPGELSKIIYVDLSNDSGKIIGKTMWKQESSGNRGDIYLPRTTPPGLYRLRAYSLYMLNTPERIHETYIRVTDGTTSIFSAATANESLNLQLQPEGGHLIAGLENKLGYFVLQSNGLPAAGAVLLLQDAAQNLVAADTATAEGLGAFIFTPKDTGNYRISVSYSGTQKEFPVPPIIKVGLRLQATPSANRIFLALSTLQQQQYPVVMIIAQMNGMVVYAQEYKLEDGTAAGAIDIRKLPAGILQIFCISNQSELLAERLAFVHKPTPASIQIENKNALQPKKEIALVLNGLPDTAYISVAITDAEPVWQPRPTITYPQYLHLSEATSGYTGPASDFFQNTESSIKKTDLLLLASGKSRFKAADVLTATMPLIRYLPQTGIAVSGTIQSTSTIPKDSRVNLIIKTEDSTTVFTDAVIQAGNRFAAGNLDFRKQARIYVKDNSSRVAHTNITLEPAYIDTLQQLPPFGGIVAAQQQQPAVVKKTPIADTALQRFQYGKKQANELNEIIITGKLKSKEQQLTEQYASEQFRQSEYTLTPDSNIAYASIWQYLLANVAGLQINGDLLTDPEVHFTRYTALRNFSAADATFVEDMNNNRSSIAFFLNEMMVPIVSITDLNPKDIALIKVNRNPNMGLNAPLGSIAIYTRKGSWWGRGDFSRALITGYNSAREFFSPQYNPSEAALGTTDLRTTLYWNASLPIKNGTATIRFFNNDVSKRLKVVVCGMDASGLPVYFEKIIE